jgi:hypothetical protein
MSHLRFGRSIRRSLHRKAYAVGSVDPILGYARRLDRALKRRMDRGETDLAIRARRVAFGSDVLGVAMRDVLNWLDVNRYDTRGVEPRRIKADTLRVLRQRRGADRG